MTEGPSVVTSMLIDPKELVARFASAVQSQNDCLRVNDPQRGNQFAAEYIEAGKALLAAGGNAVNAFATLLHHEDLSVRVMAGAFLLEARTKEAVSALEPIPQGEGLTAFGARLTLERYRRGELRLTL